MTTKRLFQFRLPGFSRLSIGRQIPLLLGGTLVLSLLFAGLVTTDEINDLSQQQADKLGNTLAEQTAHAARDPLVTGDRLSLNIVLSQLTRSETVSRATIFSIDNQKIAGTEADSFNPDTQYTTYSAPINYQNVMAGELRLEMDNTRFTRSADKALLIFLALTALLGMTGTVVAWNFARERQMLLSRSVYQLQGLCQGQIAYRKDVHDEVRQIAHQLEYLITQGSEKFPTTTPQSSEPEPTMDEQIDNIILAVRFGNLSRLNQQLCRETLIQLLEDKLPLISEAAHAHHGTLNYSAEGNAFISFPREGKKQNGVFSAVCCARLIQNLFTIEKDEGVAELSVELGISTLTPSMPGEYHPALADSAASQALMLANLGHGKLLMDAHSQECAEQTRTALIPTKFGDDIMEVGELPEEPLKVIANQTEKIKANCLSVV